jgi:hypothetical protein
LSGRLLSSLSSSFVCLTCLLTISDSDFNYELDNHGACHLVEGLAPQSKAEWCSQNPDAVDWYPPTGYRRVPLSTCVGGMSLEKSPNYEPCKGHEDEFEREHRGISGIGLFFAITIPFLFAGLAGWWVWRNWSGKFGQIRLGDSGNGNGASVSLGQGAFDADAPWIRYPIIAVSAVVAVVVAIPSMVGAIWRTGRGAAERWGIASPGRGAFSRLGGGGRSGRTQRFTTRDSFARGRGEFAGIDEDEGELLGDESDEEV